MNNEKSTISLDDILYSLIAGKWIVIILTVIGLLAGVLASAVGYVRGEMSKQYRIDASVLVSSQIKTGAFSKSTQNPTKDDIELAKEMTTQAMYIMKSDKTVSTAIEKLGMVGVSAKSIKNNLTLKQYGESQIIEISFLWRSKDEGIKIIRMLEESANSVMMNTMMIGKVISVNEPTAVYMFGGEFEISTWVYFALGGLFVGAGICVLRRLLRLTLIRPKDLDQIYGIEVLETLRFDSAFAASDPFWIEPESMDAAIASAAYILLNRLERDEIRRIYVTSAGRKEGRTTLLADLAVKISETGKKVLLVDCDFSNPSLSPLLHVDLKYENSLNALYNGDSDCSDAVIRLSGNLFLLSYLLEDRIDPLSQPMLQTIQSVAENFDLVLIDAAPVGENAEVLRLNAIADAALFVAKFDGEKMSDIDNALTRLRKSGIPLIGAIVNGTKNLRSVLFEIRKKPGRFIRKGNGNSEEKRPRKNGKKKSTVYK